jgi:pimeloyl-ACP methyl ester carboxylesterase
MHTGMYNRGKTLRALAVFLLVACAGTHGQSPSKQSIDPALATLGTGFVSSTAQVNGTTLHYIRGGTGPAVILLHGFPEDWYEFHKIIPRLATQFTVVAVDLRGAGGSAGAAGGYDAANMAQDVRQLAAHLRLKQVYVAGRDIGGMVAYAFARLYPETSRGVMLLDVALPGLGSCERIKLIRCYGISIFRRRRICPSDSLLAARLFTFATFSIAAPLAMLRWLAMRSLTPLPNICTQRLSSTAPFPRTRNSMRCNRVRSACRSSWRPGATRSPFEKFLPSLAAALRAMGAQA